MQVARTPVVRLTLPARAEHVALCRDLVAGVANAAGLDDGAIADLRAAVGEAVTNAVVHGSLGNSCPIEVVYTALAGRVVVEVADGGPGFDPRALRAPDSDLPEHGLGLALVRALADEVAIGPRSSGDGCLVRLVKRRTAG